MVLKFYQSLTNLFFSGQRALHRNICYELLTVAYGKTNAFGMPVGSEIVYNCKSLMYTSAPINMAEVYYCLSFLLFHIFSLKFSFQMTMLMSMSELIWVSPIFLFLLLQMHNAQYLICLTWSSTNRVNLCLMRTELFALFLRWRLHNSPLIS